MDQNIGAGCADLVSAMEHWYDSGTTASLEQVHAWMASDCRDAQGYLWDCLFEHPGRVEAPDISEIVAFGSCYLERCVIENSETLYADGRFSACDTLRAWFQRVWNKREEQNATVVALRDLLARLCCRGDEQITDVVMTAVLEHLFIQPEIREFFRAWEQEPILASVYRDALTLSDTWDVFEEGR
jgi:hypothetical protein